MRGIRLTRVLHLLQLRIISGALVCSDIDGEEGRTFSSSSALRRMAQSTPFQFSPLLLLLIFIFTPSPTLTQENAPVPPAVVGSPEGSGQPPQADTVPPPSLPPALFETGIAPASPVITLTPEEVNAAAYVGGPLPEGLSALTLKLQIILDQAGMSPGVIDGVNGRNVAKAIAGVEVLIGQPVDGVLDDEIWKRLPHDTPILVDYEITADDLAGPFLSEVPSDFSEMAKLDSLSYTGPLEMFGERFHMDVDLLQALNPNVDFTLAGTTIVVAGANAFAVTTPVAILVADKINAQLRGYNAESKLVVAYPATIGSDELPSPSGTHFVSAIAPRAAYYYNPHLNFKQGDNTQKLTLPPGPNNPIGTTWIDLSEPSYGIHGTPEPSKIDKTRSHGCVRLTNWDVEELAGLVEKGVRVEFQ